MHDVRPDRPRNPAAGPVEERGAVDGDQQPRRQGRAGPLVERVALQDRVVEVVPRQHPPADHTPDEPDQVPDEAEPAEVGAGVDLPAELARVCPRSDREQVRREREEQHRADGVARVGQRVGELADQEAVGDHRLAPDAVDGKRDEDAEDERVREPEPGPAAVELCRVARLHLVPEEPDPVHEPLREHVRRVRAGEQGHEGDLLAAVLLDDVRLEVVGGPAHRRSLRTSAGIPTTKRQRKAAPSKTE